MNRRDQTPSDQSSELDGSPRVDPREQISPVIPDDVLDLLRARLTARIDDADHIPFDEPEGRGLN